MKPIHERAAAYRSRRRIADDGPSLRGLVIKWLMWSALLYGVYRLGSSVHMYQHAADRIFDEIRESQYYYDSQCKNDTHVRRANIYEECKTAKRIADRNPQLEALFEVLETFNICYNGETPHAHDHGGRSDGYSHIAISHCDHINYLVVGAVFGACFIICLMRCISGTRKKKPREPSAA